MNLQKQSELFRLVAEAYRISVAHLFDSFLAVYSSLIDPLPHQISAVYERMLPLKPLRFVLADDPGAGKTIMAGLLIKEMFVRGDIRRCLIVCPGSLVEQWQDELQSKFKLDFELLTGEKIGGGGNIFANVNRCVVSMDILSRNDNFKSKLRVTDWDFVIVDEAHKMSANTKRFRLGQLLGKITRHFLLLTATPHNGKAEDFYLFMSLIDPDRFAGANRIKKPVDVSDIMRRLVKEDLLTFDGKPLFPERRAYTVNYKLSPPEMQLYNLVTNYVSEEFNRAERLTDNRKNSVGFAMTILQRRLASSPLAIYKSLERRTERLKNLLREKNFSYDFDAETFDDEFPSGDLETKENDLAERVTAAKTLAELQNEIATLQRLTDFAKKILRNGDDRKWRELSELLQDNDKISRRDKLIIFTEHRDTLNYLQEKISALFGRSEAVVAIHGGLNHKERRNIQAQFKDDENISVLIATDAAGEGINLQNAHLMINYDLSWNPNRLEQRFGRIHRIGQKKICYLWNLVAADTREGQVYQRLLKKLEEERAALGGKVFDILGKISFDNKPLRDLLIEAIRHGDNPSVIRDLDNVIDNSFAADKLQEILRERALTNDTLGADKVANINQSMERGAIRKLQPYFIENFFLTAFRKLGGQIYKRGNGCYEITHTPAALRDKINYKRVCFDKNNCAGVEFLFYGHPLLSAVCSLILEKFGDVLRQGAIFIDDNAKNFRMLFCIETKISDGRAQILSRRVHFVEVARDGQAISPNAAPYLEYRSPDDNDSDKISATLQTAQRLKSKLEKLAVDYTIKNFVAPHKDQIAAQKKITLDKLEREVKTRLRSEISYRTAAQMNLTQI